MVLLTGTELEPASAEFLDDEQKELEPASAEFLDDEQYFSAVTFNEDICLSSSESSDHTDEGLGAELYLCFPVVYFVDASGATEQMHSTSMSDQDPICRDSHFDDIPSISGLLLTPKHVMQNPDIEYVPLSQSQPIIAPSSFLNTKSFHILQSCDGLLLCRSGSEYYLCNPMTTYSEKLPSSTYMTNQFALNLAFDPKVSHHFKVICVQKLPDQEQNHHQIASCSSETRQWTLSSNGPFVAPADIDFKDGVFGNGAIHWMKRAKKGVIFHVNEEYIREMPLPLLKYPLSSCEYVGHSRGYLHYAVSCPEPPYLELFEMEKDYSGWTLKFRVDLKALAPDFPIMARRSEDMPSFFPRYECDVLSVIRAQNNYDYVALVLSIPGEVIFWSYNQKDSTRKVCDLKLRPNDRSVWHTVYSAFEYLESHYSADSLP